MPGFILIFLLFILPLIVVPIGPAFFEPPKVIIAEVLIEILLIRQILSKKLKLNIPILVLFLLTVLDLILMRTNTSFFGNGFRLQGIFLLWHLMALFWVSANIKLPKIPYSLYLISGGGLAISAFLLGTNSAGRIVGTLGEPNAYAAAIIFIWPFLFLKTKNLFFKIFLIPVVLFLIYISGSGSGFLAFGLQSLFLISLFVVKLPLKKSLVLSILLLALSFISPFVEGGGWYENRAEVWTAAAVAGANNPIFGGGFGNMEKLIPEGSRILQNNARFQYVDSSHNIFLDFWVQGGIVGLGAFLFLLFLSIRNFIKQSKYLELVVLLGILTTMSFNPSSVIALIQLWFLIGNSFYV